MATTPKKRKHIPALGAEHLAFVLETLHALPVEPAIQRQIEAMMVAAANPNAERPDVVVASLDEARRTNCEQTIRQVAGIQRGVLSRGKQGLRDISDEEWDRLVAEANDEDA
jgi:DNA-binding transcriptional regulator/RsmH inhibitor MraZ